MLHLLVGIKFITNTYVWRELRFFLLNFGVKDDTYTDHISNQAILILTPSIDLIHKFSCFIILFSFRKFAIALTKIYWNEQLSNDEVIFHSWSSI